MRQYLFLILMCGICGVFMAGCAGPVKTGLIRLHPSDYPVFRDDMDYSGLGESIRQSLTWLRRVPPDREFEFGADRFTASHMIRSLELFQGFIKNTPSPKALRGFILDNYQVYKSSGETETGQVLFTGYYEPLLSGSRQQTDEYRYPVYGPPDDLSVVDLTPFSAKLKGMRIIGRVEGKTFVPYYERREIEQAQALAGKAEELAWVGDPVALFFLQVQGSGRIIFADGTSVNVHYHSKNGRPYRSIGKLLIDENRIPRSLMSMQKIREYLAEHPEDRDRVLNYNPSYVFFSVEADGPFGALNVRLTPGRSIAVDRSIFPLSALAFIRTQKPLADEKSGQIASWTPFSRFVMSQDTGGAIKGPGRADIFWGNGPYAELAAGHLKHRGDLYVLVLKLPAGDI
ncbi:hypothetical protein DENIS_3947 [Desulfonema ishimotonii]|uniref:peptidoglycan lytic exotransglycosylase n=1 Tax=Desulfonema ishimotonii TaxID=45657 RepID=A0A401G176_9BACT|nr:MltA domain-containing protein [Desulfonema ishimotonii]GBC62961.1 hypothetical protein DENIS_3947 [Desulfonema ishimotonii]